MDPDLVYPEQWTGRITVIDASNIVMGTVLKRGYQMRSTDNAMVRETVENGLKRTKDKMISSKTI